MRSLFNFLFQSPKRMMIICIGFAFFGLVLSGDLFRLIKLIRYKQTLKNQIQSVHQSKEMIQIKMKESRSQEFLEREAFNRFDMVRDGDIIFVFNDE